MGLQTKNGILWCDFTFNIVEGCQKIAPECENCYAETRDKQYHGGEHWGTNSTRKPMSESYWKQPEKWNAWARDGVCLTCQGRTHPKECPTCSGTGKVEPYRARVFSSSLADVFEDHPDLKQPRQRLFTLISKTPHLDWLLLTKRPENIHRLTYEAIDPFGHPELDEIGESNGLDVAPFSELFPNVWLGTTAGTQKTLDKNLPELLKVPAVIHFLSAEPLLERVRLGSDFAHGLDWLIVGGESGTNARPMHPEWVRSLLGEAGKAFLPFFFKQWGEWLPCGQMDMKQRELLSGKPVQVIFDAAYPQSVYKVGKHAAGRALDFSEYDEIPEVRR